MGKQPDIEKLMAKIFTYSIKNKVKAVYFENVSLNKLKEFRLLLKTFKALPSIVEPLKKKILEFNSTRLQVILTPSEEGGLYPSFLEETIQLFESKIIWKKTSGGGPDEEIPEP